MFDLLDVRGLSCLRVGACVLFVSWFRFSVVVCSVGIVGGGGMGLLSALCIFLVLFQHCNALGIQIGAFGIASVNRRVRK